MSPGSGITSNLLELHDVHLPTKIPEALSYVSFPLLVNGGTLFDRSGRSERPRLGLIPRSRVRNDGEMGEEDEGASIIAVVHPRMEGRCRARLHGL